LLHESRTFSSLRRHRNFRLYIVGQTVSNAGTWAQMAALTWLVLQETHSALALGAFGVWALAPYVALGIFGGVIIDRFDRRLILIVTQTAFLALAVTLAALTWNGGAPVWLLYGIGALDGIVQVVDVPAGMAFVRQMVGPDDLANAVGLNSASFSAMRIVGPAVGGVLILLGGVRLCFALNALSYVVMLGALVSLRPAELLPLVRSEPHASPIHDLVEGFRYAWRTPSVRAALLTLVGLATFTFNFTPWLAVLAAQTLRAGPEVYGFITSAFGAGALLGALAVASWARATWPALLASLGGLSFGLALLAPLRSLPLILVMLVAVGAMRTIYLATSNTLVQLDSPEHLQGRVMGLYGYALTATATPGALLAGWLAQVGGTTLAFAVASVANALIFGAGLIWYLGWRRGR
jgi:MFS family permease